MLKMLGNLRRRTLLRRGAPRDAALFRQPPTAPHTAPLYPAIRPAFAPRPLPRRKSRVGPGRNAIDCKGGCHGERSVDRFTNRRLNAVLSAISMPGEGIFEPGVRAVTFVISGA